jgi:TonB-linked SusC/RagA family outer membrane protein
MLPNNNKNKLKLLLLTILSSLAPYFGFAQIKLIGQVFSAEDRTALSGVNIFSDTGALLTKTDSMGNFKLFSYLGKKIVFTHLSFKADTVPVSYSMNQMQVLLEPLKRELPGVVISTGYQLLNDRKVTGSYTHLNKTMLQRSMGPSIINRLEGISNSLAFIRKDFVGERKAAPDLRIRGKSTLFGDGSPLIILDNFPYEGDINDINPNDIESVTFLKDASSASIWGARAGNGVIVIRTVRGQRKKDLTLSYTSNITVGEKPNLYYSPNFINSADFIAIEKELYNRNFYVSNPTTLLSPVAEMLLSGKAIPENLSTVDYRPEVSQLFYQKNIHQQHALNIQGGGEKYSYFVSGGYDNQRFSTKGNSSARVSLQSNFELNPVKNLLVELGLNFTKTTQKLNGITLNDLFSPGKMGIPSYTEFKNSDGSPAVVGRSYSMAYVNQAPSEGLVDWTYRPLAELAQKNNESGHSANRINVGLQWSILPKLKWELRYQHSAIANENATHYSSESFYVRDLVNRYTQANGSRIIPLGSILEGSASQINANSARMQLAYTGLIGRNQQLESILGAEIRQSNTTGNPSYLLFGVDDKTLVGQTRFNYTMFYPLRPEGMATLPAPTATKRYLVDRFLSYYSTILYTVDRKYNFSLSARADGANLYGVKINQKIVPLWSTGLSWIINREKFFTSQKIDFLKARISYGYSGNSLKNITAFPTATYRNDARTGLRSATLRSPGNPSLRWEIIETTNFGLDFAWRGGRLKGSAEYYIKKGKDLIGDNAIDPTTGLGFQPQQGVALMNQINYASTLTKGIDIELHSKNTKGTWIWSSTLLLNVVNNQVISYNGAENPNIFAYTSGIGVIAPIAGITLDPLHSLPWHGLSPVDGSPLVASADGLTTNYGSIINSLRHKDLILHGSTVPKFSSSFLNMIEKDNFRISFNLAWKSGFFFRAPGINYSNLFTSWEGHKEIVDRWLKPGDEIFTQVPSLPSKENYDASGRRDLIYTQSAILVEKGDHLRLNDCNVSYSFPKKQSKSPNLRVVFHVQNLGILWRSNKKNIDPDYANATYPPSRTYSLGINTNF